VDTGARPLALPGTAGRLSAGCHEGSGLTGQRPSRGGPS
jgi:hypothetical protein